MQVGVALPVEIRLGVEGASGLTFGLLGSGSLTEESLSVVETMTIELASPSGAFAIRARTPATQLVTSDILKGTALPQPNYGRWIWDVTPNASGTHELVMQVVAVIADSRGIPSSTLLPDRSFRVLVRVSYGAAGWSAVRWAVSGTVGMVAAGMVGAATTDFWWPVVKRWIIDVMAYFN